MYRIRKTFRLEAAHQLPGLPPEHKCSRMHGHTYRVEIEVGAEWLNQNGFVVDFGVFDPLRTMLDHHCLNDIEGLQQPTAERLATWIATNGAILIQEARIDNWPEVLRVRVWETKDSLAEYHP